MWRRKIKQELRQAILPCRDACGSFCLLFYTIFHQKVGGKSGGPMNITERKAGDVTILDVEGKILLGEGDVQLKHKIDELVEKKQTSLVLNLANVPYMDSGGLGEIVRSFTTVKRAGGELKLLNATARISDLLTITKLYTVFDIHDDEAKAVSSFNK
jgi:anti-sigma B factor antagonist